MWGWGVLRGRFLDIWGVGGLRGGNFWKSGGWGGFEFFGVVHFDDFGDEIIHLLTALLLL